MKDKANDIYFHGTPATLEEIKDWGGYVVPQSSKTVTGEQGNFAFAARRPLLAMIYALIKQGVEIHFFYNIGSGFPAILYVGYDPSYSLLKSASVLHLSAQFFKPIAQSGEYVSTQKVPIKDHLKVNKLSSIWAGVQIFYMKPEHYQQILNNKSQNQDENNWYSCTYKKWFNQLITDANKDPNLDMEFRAIENENAFNRKFLNEFVKRGILRHLNSEYLQAGKQACVLDLESGTPINKPRFYPAQVKEKEQCAEGNDLSQAAKKSAL
jgi:hypothetical protein